MSNHDFSRRSLVLGATGLMAASASAQKPKPALTVSQVIERIKADVGVLCREQTVDGVIVGSPGTTLARLAKDMQSQLKIRTMRVVGDPGLAIHHAIASWGYVSQPPAFRLLARPDIDALIVGETREWELVEYAQDMISAGQKKA